MNNCYHDGKEILLVKNKEMRMYVFAWSDCMGHWMLFEVSKKKVLHYGILREVTVICVCLSGVAASLYPMLDHSLMIG